jgi:hypothetical protein
VPSFGSVCCTVMLAASQLRSSSVLMHWPGLNDTTMLFVFVVCVDTAASNMPSC